MRYVTYNPATGELTGAFIQDLQPGQANNYIEVQADDYANWVNLKANETRTALVLRQAVPLSLSAEELQVGFKERVQRDLDDWAQQKGYDDIVSLCTYVTSSNAAFAAQAQRGVDMRDQTWTASYAFMAAVQAGSTPMPASVAAAVAAANLPVLSWES